MLIDWRHYFGAERTHQVNLKWDSLYDRMIGVDADWCPDEMFERWFRSDSEEEDEQQIVYNEMKSTCMLARRLRDRSLMGRCYLRQDWGSDEDEDELEVVRLQLRRCRVTARKLVKLRERVRSYGALARIVKHLYLRPRWNPY